MRHYCTYFDRNYLPKAIALLRSLEKHEHSDYCVHIVCLDELTRTLLQVLNLPNTKLIPLHDIEANDPSLRNARATRTLVEYYWTLTPTVIWKILEWNPDIDLLTYLDADLYFYSSPDPIFQELGNNSILIHEHRFSSSLKILVNNGIYNVGLLSFRRNDEGITALSWWREQCNKWCFDKCEDGKMGDQKYLDDWPTRFSGVKVLGHVGAGLGPWNHEDYSFEAGSDNCPRVNGVPVVFYHFHALTSVTPLIHIPSKHPHYPITEAVLRHCYLPFFEELFRAYQFIRTELPTFACGLTQKVPTDLIYAVRKESISEIGKYTANQSVLELNSDWRILIPENPKQYLLLGNQPKLASTPPIDKNLSQAVSELNREGETCFSRGEPDKATAIFLETIKRFPENPIAFNNLGVVLSQAGKFDSAMECFMNALKVDPQNENALINAFDLIEQCEKPCYEMLEEKTFGYLDEHLHDQDIIRRLFPLQEAMYRNWLSKSEIIETNFVKRPYRLTCVVSTYKSEEFMEECLTDLCAESLGNALEIIIIDAASPQNEKSIVERSQKKQSNIRYVRLPERIGIYPAWNLGLYMASAPLVTPFSTNDRLRPDGHEIMVRFMDSHPEVALVYGDTHLTDTPHQTYQKFTPKPSLPAFKWPPFKYEQLLFNCMVGPHPVWRKSVHAKIGYFDPRYTAISDQDYWIRIGKFFTIEHIPEFTGLQWLTDESLSGRAIGKMEIFDIQRKYQKRFLNDVATTYTQEQLDYMMWLFIAILIRLIEEKNISEALAFWNRHDGAFPNSPKMQEMATMIQKLRTLSAKSGN